MLSSNGMKQMTALREQWFTEISDAIDGAQHLAWQLGARESTSAQARELFGRLEAARMELDSLRERKRTAELRIDPDWIQKFGLTMGPVDLLD